MSPDVNLAERIELNPGFDELLKDMTLTIRISPDTVWLDLFSAIASNPAKQ